jgi:hypothetical protein
MVMVLAPKKKGAPPTKAKVERIKPDKPKPAPAKMAKSA